MQFDATTINMLVKGIWETIYMVFLSSALSYVIGIPLGIALVVTDREGISPVPLFNKVLGLIINLLRSVPFIILLIMVLPITKFIVGKTIGSNATVVPLIIAAAPYIGRMVESSLKEVDAGVIEAAKSMGASTWQIIVKVLLPEAKPSLLVGAAISVTTILGYSAMAGFRSKNISDHRSDNCNRNDPRILSYGRNCRRRWTGRYRHPLRIPPLPDRYDDGDRSASGHYCAADPGGRHAHVQKE